MTLQYLSLLKIVYPLNEYFQILKNNIAMFVNINININSCNISYFYFIIYKNTNCYFFNSGCSMNPDAKRLYDDLLSNYNKLVRPVLNNTDPLPVRIKLKLSQLIDIVSYTNKFNHYIII